MLHVVEKSQPTVSQFQIILHQLERRRMGKRSATKCRGPKGGAEGWRWGQLRVNVKPLFGAKVYASNACWPSTLPVPLLCIGIQ